MKIEFDEKAQKSARFAYFSMEVALDNELPTYSGGLGVLAGDTLRAAADMAMPVCAVTLLYRQGYFKQSLGPKGHQAEHAVEWRPEDALELLPYTAAITIEGKPVHLRAYRYIIKGAKGHKVPVYFLDTALSSNSPEHQKLSGQLYGGDEHYRLCQEALLGQGGIAMLEALGLPPQKNLDDHKGPGIEVFHMNEGHAALLTMALLEKAPKGVQGELWVKARCVFTTHTPVPAGHDTFPVALAEKVLGKGLTKQLIDLKVCPHDRLNMSELAIHFSRFVNGVAKRHAEVSRKMFPGVAIEAITNGVHAVSWTADAIRELFDKWCNGWREDNNYLRYACEIPLVDVFEAHKVAKGALLAEVAKRTGVVLSPNVFTIGFARRAAEYKRADLLFHDIAALANIGRKHPLQIVFAGKAHPKDQGGKKLIERVFAGAELLKEHGIKAVYVENYDMNFGRLITSGADVWLNNPVKPLEASGTSGMKSAINGVPSLSTLDGWWVEGCVENLVGWEIKDPADAFGAAKDDGVHRDIAAQSLYELLDQLIVPGFYNDPLWYAGIMRHAMALNGPYFNTHRMVLQYLVQAYTRRV